MAEHDRFFKASAELYAATYPLETGRHVHIASFGLQRADRRTR